MRVLHRSLWLALLLVLLGAGCNSDCPVGRFPVDAKADGGLDRGPADLVPSRDATHAGWAISIGGTGLDGIWKIAVDPWGDLVVSGFFANTVSFGATTLTASPLGKRSIFLGKLDRTGKWLWAMPLDGIPPGTSLDWDGMAVDESGNIYYAGEFTGSATFGSTTLVSRGAEDLFVVKLDPGGKVLWAISAGGAGSDFSDAIAAGTDGTLTLGARFAGTVSFGATSLTARGKSDMVVARLDAASGGFVRAVQAGSDASDVDDCAAAIALDSSGNAYITGEIGPNATFGTHTLQGKAGEWKAFVAKLAASGDFLWAWESPAASLGAGIGRDAAGNIYIVSTIALSGPAPMPGQGLAEVTKLEPGGQKELYSTLIASKETTQGTAILVDDEGRVTLVGGFRGSLYLGPTQVVAEGYPLNGYLAQLDVAGDVIGGQRLPSTVYAAAISLARGPGGDVYLAGQFAGTATLGTSLTSTNGSIDAFVWNRGPDQE